MGKEREAKDLTRKVKEFATEAGAHIVGIVSVDQLEAVIPTEQTPLKLLKSGKSVIAYGVPVLRGVIQGGDLRLKRYNHQSFQQDCKGDG